MKVFLAKFVKFKEKKTVILYIILRENRSVNNHELYN